MKRKFVFLWVVISLVLQGVFLFAKSSQTDAVEKNPTVDSQEERVALQQLKKQPSSLAETATDSLKTIHPSTNSETEVSPTASKSIPSTNNLTFPMLDVESGLAATGTQKSYPTNYISNYLTGQGAASKTVALLGNLDSLVPELSGFYPHEQFDKQITTTKSHILNNDFTQGTQVFTNNQPDDVANISNYFYDYGDFYLRKWAAPSTMAAASANNYEVYIDIINKLQEESPSKLVDLVIIRNNFNPFPTGNFEPTGKNESMLAHNNLMFQAQSEILSTYRNDKNVRIGYVRNDNWQPTECIWLDQNNQNADTTNVGGYWSLVKELQAAVKGLESARPNARKAILYIDNLYGPLTITGSSSTNDLSYTGGAAVDFYQRQNNFYFKQMLPEIKKIALEDIHISTAVYGINADEAVNNPYFTNLVSLMDTVSSDNWTQLIPFGSDQATINQLLEEVVGNIFVPQPKTFAIEEETGEYLSSVGHLGGLGNTTNATYDNISTYPIDTAANTIDWSKPTALPVEHAEITGHLSATGNQTFSIKNLNVSPKQLVRLHYTLQLNQGTRNGLFRQISGNDSKISFNEKTYQNLPNASVRNFGGGHTIQVTKTDELGNPVPNVPYALYEKQIDQNGVEKEVLLYTAPTILQTINPGTANERQVAVAEFPENILHISHNYSGLEGKPPDFWEANMIGWSNQYIVREVTDNSLYPFPESILPYEKDIVFRGGSYQVGNEAPKVRLIEKNGQTSANISNRLTMKLTSENDFYLVNIDLINDLSPLSLELKKFVGYSDTNLVNKDTALAGAEFRFFKVDGTQEVEQASGTSQSDGTVAFSNNQQPFEITEPGTYRIRETTTPKGYRQLFDDTGSGSAYWEFSYTGQRTSTIQLDYHLENSVKSISLTSRFHSDSSDGKQTQYLTFALPNIALQPPLTIAKTNADGSVPIDGVWFSLQPIEADGKYGRLRYISYTGFNQVSGIDDQGSGKGQFYRLDIRYSLGLQIGQADPWIMQDGLYVVKELTNHEKSLTNLYDIFSPYRPRGYLENEQEYKVEIVNGQAYQLLPDNTKNSLENNQLAITNELQSFSLDMLAFNTVTGPSSVIDGASFTVFNEDRSIHQESVTSLVNLPTNKTYYLQQTSAETMKDYYTLPGEYKLEIRPFTTEDVNSSTVFSSTSSCGQMLVSLTYYPTKGSSSDAVIIAETAEANATEFSVDWDDQAGQNAKITVGFPNEPWGSLPETGGHHWQLLGKVGMLLLTAAAVLFLSLKWRTRKRVM